MAENDEPTTDTPMARAVNDEFTPTEAELVLPLETIYKELALREAVPASRQMAVIELKHLLVPGSEPGTQKFPTGRGFMIVLIVRKNVTTSKLFLVIFQVVRVLNRVKKLMGTLKGIPQFRYQALTS